MRSKEPTMRYGLCCISLDLNQSDIKFQTMTYKRFSSLPRAEALATLGDRILNNLFTTYHIIEYCAAHNYSYRLSSDLFPLITYDKANVSLEDLPNYLEIIEEFTELSKLIQSSKVRISCHPSEFNVLASTNLIAVDKTITELNFFSWFMDQIGCEASYNCPMNIHVHNTNGTHQEIISRFMTRYDRLSDSCKQRLVIENDDKLNCWSVSQLIKYLHTPHNIPITFDYLHHSCHPDNLSEQDALESCYLSWGSYRPLFHYSESSPGNNPRKHADYAVNPINTYGLNFDLDFELKMKDHAIQKHSELFPPCIKVVEKLYN